MTAAKRPSAPIGQRFCVIGGAGFLGSHIVRRLLADVDIEQVVVFDNFSSGRIWHLDEHVGDSRLHITRGDARDLRSLSFAIDGSDVVVHLAANPDIARAVTEPTIDFDQGTYLTYNAVEAMRLVGTTRILYASGSGVYGDLGEVAAWEDYGPMLPVSTYGASKLAGEALISSYCHMFGFTGCAFRFGNIVGPHQTHGVGYDFIHRLVAEPSELTILGDGRQTKSYVHVDDVIDAIFVGASQATLPFTAYNVATSDYVAVAEIARLAMDVLGLAPNEVKLCFTGGDRGWRGDVPVVRLNTDKIRALGWSNRLRARDALRVALESMAQDVRSGKFDD